MNILAAAIFAVLVVLTAAHFVPALSGTVLLLGGLAAFLVPLNNTGGGK